MLDPELKQHLERIEGELRATRHMSAGFGQSLLRGILYGAGYIIGAVIIIVIVGWVLNIVGIIPAFARQVGDFRTALQNIGGVR